MPYRVINIYYSVTCYTNHINSTRIQSIASMALTVFPDAETAENEARNFRMCQTEEQMQNLPVTHAVLSGSPPSIMQSICTMLLDNDDNVEDSRLSVSMSAKCSTLKQLT